MIPKPTVMIVDDEAIIRNVSYAVLSRKYNVILAPDVAQAKREVNAQTIDAIITDQIMSGELGTDLIRYLNQKYPTIPVSLMSGNTFGADLTELTIYKVLEKPVSNQILRETVAKMIVKSEDQ